jgi:hypothetical protein
MIKDSFRGKEELNTEGKTHTCTQFEEQEAALTKPMQNEK